MKARHEFSSEQEYQEYLRIYFAAMAMQGLLAQSNGNSWDYDLPALGKRSLTCADAPITALNQQPTI